MPGPGPISDSELKRGSPGPGRQPVIRARRMLPCNSATWPVQLEPWAIEASPRTMQRDFLSAATPSLSTSALRPASTRRPSLLAIHFIEARPPPHHSHAAFGRHVESPPTSRTDDRKPLDVLTSSGSASAPRSRLPIAASSERWWWRRRPRRLPYHVRVPAGRAQRLVVANLASTGNYCERVASLRYRRDGASRPRGAHSHAPARLALRLPPRTRARLSGGLGVAACRDGLKPASFLR